METVSVNLEADVTLMESSSDPVRKWWRMMWREPPTELRMVYDVRVVVISKPLHVDKVELLTSQTINIPTVCLGTEQQQE